MVNSYDLIVLFRMYWCSWVGWNEQAERVRMNAADVVLIVIVVSIVIGVVIIQFMLGNKPGDKEAGEK